MKLGGKFLWHNRHVDPLMNTYGLFHRYIRVPERRLKAPYTDTPGEKFAFFEKKSTSRPRTTFFGYIRIPDIFNPYKPNLKVKQYSLRGTSAKLLI